MGLAGIKLELYLNKYVKMGLKKKMLVLSAVAFLLFEIIKAPIHPRSQKVLIT